MVAKKKRALKETVKKKKNNKTGGRGTKTKIKKEKCDTTV